MLTARVFIALSFYIRLSQLMLLLSPQDSMKCPHRFDFWWSVQTGGSKWRFPKENITLEFVFIRKRCPLCIACRPWVFYEIGRKWLYRYFFVGGCLEDLIWTLCKTLAYYPSNFFYIELDFVVGQNTEKSPGYLRKLSVIQTQRKDHQLMLAWKTPKE